MSTRRRLDGVERQVIPSQWVTDIRVEVGAGRVDCKLASASWLLSIEGSAQQTTTTTTTRPNSFNSRVTSSSTSDPTKHRTSLFFSFSGYTFPTHSFTTHLPTLATPSLVFLPCCPCVQHPKQPLLASNQLSITVKSLWTKRRSTIACTQSDPFVHNHILK